MGFLDQLKDQALSKVSQLAAEHGPVAQKLAEMVQQQGFGSLPNLVQTFKDKGMGDLVNSWISSGKNLPITAAQIQQVLGHQKVQDLAQKFGVSTDQISQQLAQHLPTLIDKLTPNGKLPDNA